MENKSIIIIGGGLAGLSAGCYALMNGYDVQIYEHAAIPGGVCTSWKTGNYLIDGCIHWLAGHRPGASVYEIYRELGIVDTAKFLNVKSYINFVDAKTGKHFELTSDYENVKSQLIRISPEDKGTIEKFLQACLVMAELQMPTGGSSEKKKLLYRLAELRKKGKILKYFFKYNLSLKDYAKKIKNKWVKDIMVNLFLQDMTTLFSMLMLGYLFNNQLGMVEGGSIRFVLPIEKRFKKLGGKITYNMAVDKILVENDAAVGVKLSDGSVHKSDIVISAADLHSTLFDMLDGKYVGKRFEYMFKNWKMFSPLMLISFGVTGDIKRYPPVNVFFLKEPFKIGNTGIDRLLVRDYSYDKVMNPGDKTVIQAEIETEYDYWMELRKNKEEYYKEKDNVAQNILNKLEEFYPGIKSKVEMIDVVTPCTFLRYTRNYRGAFEGWLMTGETLRMPVPKTLNGLKNFYLTGQWVEPGGGVPTAVASGRRIIRNICYDAKREFVTKLP
ncbi:MAG: NAD(P)/FAD-dependent oxidoreductase [Deltaproteobacteria bacterium]|nr:NAD(P)/FAD-dependent oxidoreductase [Deltaproteobacteria bacterium]MCL5793114.1 NAD(P)/FAD-dependent oxidoreductase [Deltaproteobacteria bacterium]